MGTRTICIISSGAVCLALHAFAPILAAPGAANEQPVSAGMVREFTATDDEVRQAALEQVKDQIIHGTKIFDKEPVLTGAEAADSTPLFDPWTGPGNANYKIRKNAIAPRHFLESEAFWTQSYLDPVEAFRPPVHPGGDKSMQRKDNAEARRALRFAEKNGQGSA